MLSVITVTFEDPLGLRDTLQSISSLLGRRDCEVIVVNGSADSATAEILGRFPGVKLIAEPDFGIYDAMNKGIAAASGDFLWFLNGGDKATFEAMSADELLAILKNDPEVVWLFGFKLSNRKRMIQRRPRRAKYLLHGLPTSHQAMFFPYNSVREIGGYDLSYKISSDYYLAARLFAEGVQFRRRDEPVAIFEIGGTSTKHAEQIAKDAERVQREVIGVSGLRRCCSRIRHRLSRAARSLLNTAR